MCTVQHWLTFINLITHTRHEDEQYVWALFVLQWCTTDTFIFQSDFMVHAIKANPYFLWSLHIDSEEVVAACVLLYWKYEKNCVKITRNDCSKYKDSGSSKSQRLIDLLRKCCNDELCLWGLHLAHASRRISESQPLLRNNTQACCMLDKYWKNANLEKRKEKKTYITWKWKRNSLLTIICTCIHFKTFKCSNLRLVTWHGLTCKLNFRRTLTCTTCPL